jgi:hypothetical protein
MESSFPMWKKVASRGCHGLDFAELSKSPTYCGMSGRHAKTLTWNKSAAWRYYELDFVEHSKHHHAILMSGRHTKISKNAPEIMNVDQKEAHGGR